MGVGILSILKAGLIYVSGNLRMVVGIVLGRLARISIYVTLRSVSFLVRELEAGVDLTKLCICVVWGLLFDMISRLSLWVMMRVLLIMSACGS